MRSLKNIARTFLLLDIAAGLRVTLKYFFKAK
ncbi:MAG: NADH-quinone oxidoreductase subunit I, partial [Proteobacteria bacterium]|nr:NADH-quinone oxidoreductase subunit I [Pseudomonadota bacterium]